MQVFKFGGASVKDARAVINLAEIVRKHKGRLVVVVSAMGKTTNALERVVSAFMENDVSRAMEELREVRNYHAEIVNDLFNGSKGELYDKIENVLSGLENYLKQAPSAVFNQEYDQIVIWGEIMSTLIVSYYLTMCGIENQWVDARQILKTDSSFREGKPDWNISEMLVKETIDFSRSEVYVTQGFIASTVNNLSITLGREGSDYTAAILANILDAESVTVWKDVPGLLNADPKWFDDTVRLDAISFLDAIELAYYGTGVIHPKTIQPLRNKNIPLYVKSFLNPDGPGTIIGRNDYDSLIPSFIFKMDQVLIHVHPVDFSFIAEDNLEKIFRCFAGFGLKINLMQNSAVCFDVCVNNDAGRLPLVLNELRKDFRVGITSNLELVTIRYYDDKTIERVLVNKELLLTQKTPKTIQMVVKDLGQNVNI